MQTQPALLITHRDYQKISSLLAGVRSPATELLEEELNRAKIVASEELPGDIVSMNSTVRFVDLDTEKESVVTLVFPREANVAENKISILAPVGVALIGLQVGQEMNWPLPGGKVKKLRVVSVIYQPEASESKTP